MEYGQRNVQVQQNRFANALDTLNVCLGSICVVGIRSGH